MLQGFVPIAISQPWCTIHFAGHPTTFLNYESTRVRLLRRTGELAGPHSVAFTNAQIAAERLTEMRMEVEVQNPSRYILPPID